MVDLSNRSILELQCILGEQIRSIRLSKNLSQRTTAERAGVSEKALKNLEGGHGSSVETLLRVLKALDTLSGLELLAPKPSVNPLALLKGVKERKRARAPMSAQGRGA